MPPNGLLITRSNIHELTPNDILSFSSKEYWHKFILENGGLLDKEAVLLAVLDSVAPFDLVPVKVRKYTIEGKNAYFLARNCGQAIEKFCLNLLLPIRLKEGSGEVIMTIQTCSIPIEQYKMNMQFHLKKAIEKRYDKNKNGFINLSLFHKEPELFDVLFCPLSKPRFLVYVLSILKRIFSITAINLSHNNIEILKPLEILQEFEELVSLDLSYNKICDSSLPDLLKKSVPKLQELNLSGNPICSIFKTETEYLKWIRDKIYLKVLDGISLNNGVPNKQIYFCSEQPLGLVNEFLKHYFTLYDGKRKALENVYEKNAIFSMTCDHSSENLKDSKLDCYKYESKNLLKINGESKIMGIFHYKNSNIANVLWRLPSTEHDPFTFKVDILFYKEPFIVLVVSGIFKDFQDSPQVRSFSRTFSLKLYEKSEIKIINDLYHVRDATNDEVSNSFVHPKPRVEKLKTEFFITKEEKQNLIQVISRLTEMNSAYSKRCLEECGWDVKKSLEAFLENYKNFKIPPQAYYEDPSK